MSMHMYTGGTDAPDLAARDAHRRLEREQFARTSNLAELKRADLRIGKFGIIQHLPSGNQFCLYRGLIEAGPYHPVNAFYRAADGGINFLERVGGGR